MVQTCRYNNVYSCGFILFKVFFEFDKFSAAGVFVYWMVFDEWFPACFNVLEKEDKWLI